MRFWVDKEGIRLPLGWMLGGLLALGFVLAAWPSAAAAAAAPDTKATLKKAADYVEWGRLKEARALLASAVADPEGATDAPLIAFYGHVLIKFGELRAGTDLAKRAVTLDDKCATCHLYLFEALATRTKTMGQMRALLMLPKLKRELAKATELGPQLGDVQWAWIDFDLGLPKAAGGSASDALAHAERLRQIDPVDGRLARAQIAEAGGHPEQALAEYQAAASEHPEDPRGIFAWGKALYQQGDFAAAEASLARALELNHESALYSAYQAAALVHLKKLASARAVIEAGQKAHPDSRLGEYMVAQALKDTGQDFDWAKTLVAAYLAVPPEPEQPTAAAARTLLAALA